MFTLDFLQHYWWFLISLLGALLVFLLFVQGGQALLYALGRSERERTLIVNSLGRKWEFTFTTLVTFGGAFFASFPLFYSTSFGGVCYVWFAILMVFVIQAVAYEFRHKPANVLGGKTFNVFLLVNGFAGPLLLGTALGTLYTGAPFTVDRLNMADMNGDNIISQWTTPWHGLEAVASPALLLGIAVALLSMLLGCHHLLHDTGDDTLRERTRKLAGRGALPFLLFFLAWLALLLTGEGYAADPDTGVIVAEPYRYLRSLARMPALSCTLISGIILVATGLLKGCRGSRAAIRFSGTGTVLTVLALLLLAGWNGTAYYPSVADLQSSLTIRNSSSSLFTLRVMSVVSLLIPIIFAYVFHAWRAISNRPLTSEEVEAEEHSY